MKFKPIFPTTLHRKTAEVVHDYFSALSGVDTVLIVNSCARGHAVAESDLDLAILVKPTISNKEIKEIEKQWLNYSSKQTTTIKYKKSSPFAHVHVDIINGKYTPGTIEVGEPCNYFELEIGNQICYAAPMHIGGKYFQALQEQWLPYYAEDLSIKRFRMITDACRYDLDHIPFFIKRELYFQAFDILCKAFQEYLQALFIANRTYPIAYNKWIKYQVVNLLNKPGLYPLLAPVLSVSNIECNEINDKVAMLNALLNELT